MFARIVSSTLVACSYCMGEENSTPRVRYVTVSEGADRISHGTLKGQYNRRRDFNPKLAHTKRITASAIFGIEGVVLTKGTVDE